MEDSLLGIGASMLSQSQRRLEIVTNNVANMSTPGFKKQSLNETFASALTRGASQSMPNTNFSQGTLKATSEELDLAISGEGYFQVRDENGAIYYTRSGQFSRAVGGLVTDGRGMILTSPDGGDVRLPSGDITITTTGTVLQNGRPISRIGIFNPAASGNMQMFSGSLFTNRGTEMTEVDVPMVRQGQLETSNVEISVEMTDVMGAMRQAETGSRIVQTFDTLMGQVLSTFGKSGR